MIPRRMPRVLRTMLCDGAYPQVGTGSKMLGARLRVHGAQRDDLPLAADGQVHPNTGGISVFPSLASLVADSSLHFLVPRRFAALAPHATGSDRLCVWQAGVGAFEDGPFAPNLKLRVDRPTHGQVEPDQVMALETYQDALAQTREKWSTIPEDVGCPAQQQRPRGLRRAQP